MLIRVTNEFERGYTKCTKILLLVSFVLTCGEESRACSWKLDVIEHSTGEVRSFVPSANKEYTQIKLKGPFECHLGAAQTTERTRALPRTGPRNFLSESLTVACADARRQVDDTAPHFATKAVSVNGADAMATLLLGIAQDHKYTLSLECSEG